MSRQFATTVLQALLVRLRRCRPVRAVWQGGSAANATSDAYSDIDLNILAGEPAEEVFTAVAEALGAVSPIVHVWNEPKSVWPELTQKVYFLADSPKHFFVDVALFPESDERILAEFMQVERHGTAIVHFDDTGKIESRRGDRIALVDKQKKRLAQIVEAFPVYRTEVFKELDRGHAIDAFAYFQGGMLKPWVELLAMIHRPFQFDFGFRYLHRSFPPELAAKVETFLYVSSMEKLRENAMEVERSFPATVEEVRAVLEKAEVDARAVVSL